VHLGLEEGVADAAARLNVASKSAIRFGEVATSSSQEGRNEGRQEEGVKGKASSRSGWDLGSGLVLIVWAVLFATTQGDYGLSWDEQHSRQQGVLFYRWYASNFEDRAIHEYGNFWVYGQLFNGLGQIAIRMFAPDRPYEVLHVCSSIFAWFGALAVWGIGRQVGGPRAAFLALLLFATNPVVFGHAFMNPKDVPLSTMTALSTWALLACYARLPEPPLRLVLAAAVAVGCAMGVRIAAILQLGWMVALLALWCVEVRVTTGELPGRKAIRSLVAVAFTIVALSWVTMLVWWPTAQLDPVRFPFHALSTLANFAGGGPVVYFANQVISSDHLPLSYLPMSFAMALPDTYFVSLPAAVVGIVVLARARAIRTIGLLAILVGMAVAPVAAAIVHHSVVYDGIRHFLFVLPPITACLGVLLSAAFDARVGRALTVLAGFAVPLVVWDGWRIYPYEYAYYNRLVAGGFARAGLSYENDYWILSHKEAFAWLLEQDLGGAPLRLANTSDDFLTAYPISRDPRLAERFVATPIAETTDLLLCSERWKRANGCPGRELHTVERLGVPLMHVMDVRSPGG
jgi:hypothetical protein